MKDSERMMKHAKQTQDPDLMQPSTTIKSFKCRAIDLRPKTPEPASLGSSILPDGFKVKIPAALRTAHTPSLALVPGPESHGASSTGDVQAAAALGLGRVTLGSICSGLELGDPLCLKGGLFSVGCVRDSLQAGNAGTTGPGGGRG